MIKTYMAAAALTLASQAHAVTVAQWDFESAIAPAGSAAWTGIAPSSGSGTASAVHASASAWSTPVGNGSARSISANAWTVGDYWQFGFSTTGYVDLVLTFDHISSGTGPRDFKLAYSTNGTAFTDFAPYAVLANATPNTWTSGLYSAVSTISMDLSAVTALDNQGAVLVRLIDISTMSAGGGAVASAGTSRIDNFTVNLSPVPEAGTAAMWLAGLAAIGFVSRRGRAA